MSEVYDRYVDTAGNYHYTDVETGDHTIRIKTLPLDMPPSHFCAICGKIEHDNAVICTSAFWLCNKCLGKLKKIIKETD